MQVPAPGSRRLSRALASVGAAVCTWLALQTFVSSDGVFWTPVAAAFAAAAVMGGWYALFGGLPASRVRIARTVRWGLLTGAVTGALGFFGPLVLMPESNQGPLFGIFVTGPLGFALGAVAGAVADPALEDGDPPGA